jgi:hypothetical protein
MASLNEFGLQSTAIEEWLPWGGIIRPSVMRQKDGSMFSIITYDPYTTDLSSTLPLWEFCRGWAMWNEHQHAVGSRAQDYLIIGWNPFETNGRIENALRPGIMAVGSVDYFDQEIHRFLADFQKLTAARLLEYQEIMDVLSFSLSMGEDRQEMPDCPLYMDALLSQNVDFEFGSNDVFINGKRICAVSLFAPDGANDLYQQLEHVTYRHVRRMLLFNKKQAKHDLLKYTSRWFPTRSVIRHMATDDLFGDYNGYYTDTLLFPLDEEHDAPFQAELRGILNQAELPYIVEEYNLKEVFWGSIPGLFLANAYPPVTGFHDLSEFLHATIEIKEEREDILEQAEGSLNAETPSEKIEGGEG